MAISAISIDQLKCFLQLRLEIAPLTLATGFNAAGKSTALQALLLLAQASRVSPRAGVVYLNGPLVRLGLPGDVIAAHGGGRSLSIGLETDACRMKWTLEARELGEGVLRIAAAQYLESDGQLREWSEAIWPEDMLRSSLHMTVANVIYLSAARVAAAEAYPAPDDVGQVVGDVGTDGAYAPWWYVQSADDVVEEARRHPKETASSFRRQLDAYLSDLFPGGQANAESITGTSLTRLQLRNSETDDWRRPANIGYGFTYSFPILVALLKAERGQIVVLDSPEAHLHPQAQSAMGGILARFAAAGVQILVETHSDHVLNGVRLAVRNDMVPPSQVAIHFFAGATEDTHGVLSPRIDEMGALDSWPSGFFDQAEGDLARLAGWS